MMRRFLSNADALRKQHSENKVLRPKRWPMINKHFEMLLFLRANKN